MISILTTNWLMITYDVIVNFVGNEYSDLSSNLG